MPLSPQEQKEMDALELEQLEHEHAASQGASPAVPQEPSLKGGPARSLGDFLSPGFNQGVVQGAVKQSTLGNVDIDSPTSSDTGHAVGTGLAMAGQAALGGGAVNMATTGAGRVAASAGVNGLQGFLQKPGGEDGFAPRAKNAAIGATLGALIQGTGEGASKAGDWAMQKAVGMKKYIPGMGKELADEGLMGTKGMMAKQVEKALPVAEGRLTSSIDQMKGSIDPADTAAALRAKAAPYIPKPGPSGPMPVPSPNQPFVDAASSRAEEALARGALAPSEALSTARAVAKPAYGMNGDPLNSFKQQLSQTEGGSLKDALKSMADEQNLPGVRDSLKTEAALLTARRGLTKPDNMQAMIAKSLLKAGVGGAVGGAVGGKEGAAVGAALSTPLGQSLAGRAALSAGSAAPYAAPSLSEILLKLRNQEGAK